MLKSLKEYLGLVRNAFKRFPVAIAFAILTPIALSYFYYNADSNSPNIIQNIFTSWCFTYPVEAIFIALTISLIQESRKSSSKLPQILSSVSWLVISIILVYLVHTPDYYNFRSILKTIICIYVTSFVVLSSGILFIKDENRLWNYQKKIFESMTTAITATIILTILTSIAFDLMSPKITEHHSIIIFFFFCLVFPIFCMAGIPRIDESLDETPSLKVPKIIIKSKRFNIPINLNKFFILPLYALYAIYVFYYSATAFSEWRFDLNRILEHALFLKIIISALNTYFYPALISSKPSFEKTFARIIPYTNIPIIITMTIGIVERISEYGISENRLYYLGINLFFFIYTVIRIIPKIIPTKYTVIIFCTIFTALMIGPINAIDVTRNVWLSNIKENLTAEGYNTFPLSEEDSKTFFANLWKKDEHKASILASQVRILHSRHDEKLYQYFPENRNLADITKKARTISSTVKNDKIHTMPKSFSKAGLTKK